MKRSGKLILLLLVAVLLCGGYLAVQHFTQKETVETEEVEIALLNAEADDVVELSWALDGETVSLQKTDAGWTMEGDGAFPVDQTTARQLADDMAGLTANRQLTGVETLSDYGLEEPTFAVTVTLADGSWYLISQGSLNALSNDAYVQISGDDSVYVVSDAPADSFDLGLEDLMALEVLPEIGDVMDVHLSTPEKELTVRYQAAGSDAYVDVDTGKQMDADAVNALIDALGAIDWTGCISYAATDEERIACGLDEPTAEVRVTFTSELAGEDGETTLETGEYGLLLGGTSSDDGSVYAATAADSSMIYTISSDDAQTIYDALDGGLESAKVFSVDWEDVAQVRATVAGEELVIARAADEPEAAGTAEAAPDEEATEATADAETAGADEAADTAAAWLANGMAVDAEMWARFTEAVDALETTEAESEGEGDVLLTLAIERSDGMIQSAEILDSSADAYALAGEARTLDAAAIDEIVRILRHLN